MLMKPWWEVLSLGNGCDMLDLVAPFVLDSPIFPQFPLPSPRASPFTLRGRRDNPGRLERSATAASRCRASRGPRGRGRPSCPRRDLGHGGGYRKEREYSSRNTVSFSVSVSVCEYPESEVVRSYQDALIAFCPEIKWMHRVSVCCTCESCFHTHLRYVVTLE